MILALDRTVAQGGERPPRIAVIDIGSNSIRLVVYDGLKRSPLPVFNEKVMCGLGRGYARTGRLNPDGVGLALDNLERFKRIADGMKVDRLDVLATAAVRDADDGPAFVAEAERRCGFTITIISGEEEARLAAMGVLSGTPGADGLVGDLGGGSLELVTLDHGAIGPQATLPLGPLRLMEAGTTRQSSLLRQIDQHLETLPWLEQGRGRDFFPVGGNWRALAKLHMEQTNHPLHVIHHYAVSAADMRDFAALIARQSRSSLEKMTAGSRRRIDTLPYAALVLERVLRTAQPATVVFSAFGLREGHLFDLLRDEERRIDPLTATCTDLAEGMGRFGASTMLVSWIAGLFAGEDDAAQRLRQAACLLSDVAWAEHPDYRAEHAFLRILRFPFPGIDHAERAFLALVAYARYAGRIDGPLTESVRTLVPEGQVAKALVMGLALRLGLTVTGGVPALLQRTSVRMVDDRLVLTLPEDGRALAGDVVQRRLEALAKVLNRTAEVVVAPG